jgi:hypothetical protein
MLLYWRTMSTIQGGISLGFTRRGNGVPSNGTNEVQTINTTGTPTGGTFRLSFEGFVTAAIAFNAAAAIIQAALEALPSIGAGNVVCAGGPLGTGAVTATFQGNRGRQVVALLALAENALTGGTAPTATVVETTPGVDATERGAPRGAQYTNTATGVVYTNMGTETAPTWTVVGTQT